MSKRTRGTARTTQRRPGTRPPTTRSATPRGRLSRERQSTAAESQLEQAPQIAEDRLDERPAEEVVQRQAAASRPQRAGHTRTRVKPGSLLASRAATEYVYVAQDIKRIVFVTLVLSAAMAVLYVLLVVLRVVPLPFY